MTSGVNLPFHQFSFRILYSKFDWEVKHDDSCIRSSCFNIFFIYQWIDNKIQFQKNYISSTFSP